MVRADDTIVLGGSTAGNWIGTSAGGYDFDAVALDADGEEIWRWQVTRMAQALDNSCYGKRGYIVGLSFLTQRAALITLN